MEQEMKLEWKAAAQKEIEGLRAEVARLTADRDAWSGAAHEYEEQARFARSERDKAEAFALTQHEEIARLTAALAEADTTLKDLHSGMSFDATAREAAARKEEREACAQIADNLGDSDHNDTVLHNHPPAFSLGYEMGARAIAAAIRARTTP